MYLSLICLGIVFLSYLARRWDDTFGSYHIFRDMRNIFYVAALLFLSTITMFCVYAMINHVITLWVGLHGLIMSLLVILLILNDFIVLLSHDRGI